MVKVVIGPFVLRTPRSAIVFLLKLPWRLWGILTGLVSDSRGKGCMGIGHPFKPGERESWVGGGDHDSGCGIGKKEEGCP